MPNPVNFFFKYPISLNSVVLYPYDNDSGDVVILMTS